MPQTISNQNSKPKWAIQFKVDDATWASLCAQAAQKNITPLEHAIEIKLLSESQILEWDRDQSGIAVLKDAFFEKEPPIELFKKYDFALCRKNGVMPVADWNGQVYWAKISSDLTAPGNGGTHSLWFLAPVSALNKWFATWESSLGENPSPIELGDAISIPQAGGQVAVPEISVAMDFGALTKVEPAVNLSPAMDFVAPSFGGTDFSGPEGLELELDLGFGNKDASSAPVVAAEPQPVTDRPTEAPLEMELNLEKFSSETATSTALPAPEAEPDAFSLIMPMPSTAIANDNVITPAPPAILAPLSAAVPPPTPLREKKVIPPIPLDQFESRLKHATTQDGLAETLMGVWQNYFEQTMILLFQSEKLVIWWNNHQWKSTFERGAGVSIDKPSIFKIVHDTARPYHGYIAKGPLNDEFFTIANRGEYPEHVSVVPVLAGDRVVAMLLGTCSQATGQQLILEKLEGDGQVFASALIRLMNPKSKAS